MGFAAFNCITLTIPIVKKINRALISVYHKDGLEEIVTLLDSAGVEIVSTGGTWDFISKLGIKAVTVESLTGYPSILGGRVISAMSRNTGSR